MESTSFASPYWHLRKWFLVAIVTIAGCLAILSPSFAQFVVTNTSDSLDPNSGCLRAAITAANLTNNATITFATDVAGTIQLIGPLPAITSSMSIAGPSGNPVAIDGGGLYLPINIDAPGDNIAFSNLTVQNGNGGGISDVAGGLTLSNCVFATNNANGGAGVNCNGNTVTVSNCTFTRNNGNTAYGGAGLYTFLGNITITNCTFSGNMLTQYASGGAIRSDGGTVTLTGCTLSGNTTVDGGGNAISNYGGTLTLTNCTLSGNTTVDGQGGAILNANGGTASLVNCTITGNSSAQGGAVFEYGGTVSLTNCILYGDTAPEVDLSSGTGSAAYCDISGGVAASDLTDNGGNIDSDPLFAAAGLASNGGPTQTIALAPGSPCLGAGTATGAPATDQRGATRPNPPSMGAYDIPPSLNQFQTGLAMISAPVDDSLFTPDQQFTNPVVLAIWNPSATPSPQYVISPTAPADTVRPGLGYWARFYSPTDLLEVGTMPDTAQTYTVPLASGWNMIGDARATSVSSSALSISYSGQSYTIAQAITAGLITGATYTYQPGDTTYETLSLTTNGLQPYIGYWIDASQPFSLVFAAQ